MPRNKILIALVVCALMLGNLSMSASASEQNSAVISLKELKSEVVGTSALSEWSSNVKERAFARIDISIPANTMTAAKSQNFSLEAGEVVRINCSYSPMSASVDFGLLAPDGYFYYERVTSGDINKAIQVDERGTYILAVRNNSSDTVSVVGFVHY